MLPQPQEQAPEARVPQPPDRELYQRLLRQAEFCYPYQQAALLPAKVSASKLAAQQDGSREVTLSRPAWLGEQGLTPAQRGTALHAFLQFADFESFQRDPEGERRRLVSLALLAPEQGGRGGSEPGAEVFGEPLGPADPPLPPGGAGEALCGLGARLPGPAGQRRPGGRGDPPGGGGLHLCGGGAFCTLWTLRPTGWGTWRPCGSATAPS